jgi:hypothetical protein
VYPKLVVKIHAPAVSYDNPAGQGYRRIPQVDVLFPDWSEVAYISLLFSSRFIDCTSPCNFS